MNIQDSVHRNRQKIVFLFYVLNLGRKIQFCYLFLCIKDLLSVLVYIPPSASHRNY